MTINERIKYFRKNYLHFNQTVFAESLGMKQTSISSIEKVGATVTDQTLTTLCTVYNINRQWLIDGTGPMLAQPAVFSLDQFVKENGMSNLELQILKLYFSLDPQKRQAALNYFMDGLADEERFMTVEDYKDECPKTLEELERLYPPVEKKPKVI